MRLTLSLNCIYKETARLTHSRDVLAQSALRAPSTGNPPLNMHRAIIFNAVFTTFAVSLVFGLEGRQARRERDEMVLRGEVGDAGET